MKFISEEALEAMKSENSTTYVPAHLVGGLLRYFEQGVEPGHFLTYLLQGDKLKALDHADYQSQAGFPTIQAWLAKFAPSGSHGSERNYRKWLRSFLDNPGKTT